MAINRYFQDGTGNGDKPEQDLVEDTIIEMIQLAGTEFYYIPRTMVKEDKVLHENPLAKFERYYPIEMYMNTATNFGGQGHLLGKFGLEVNDTIELIVSKRRINDEIPDLVGETPGEGDLIYWPLLRSVWQIDFVEEEAPPFYVLSNLYTFNLKCTRYTFSYEDFETGVADIDNELTDDFVAPFEKNDEIVDEGSDALNFDENNPFGTIIDES